MSAALSAKRRHMTAAAAVLLTLMLIFSLVFVTIAEAGHECGHFHNEECEVCDVIAAATSVIKAAAFVLFAVLLTSASRGSSALSGERRRIALSDPVALRVKLSN